MTYATMTVGGCRGIACGSPPGIAAVIAANLMAEVDEALTAAPRNEEE